MKTTLISVFIIIVMSGCSSYKPPSCSEKKIKISIKSLYTEVLKNLHNSSNPFLTAYMQALPQKIQSFSLVKATAYNNFTNIKTCKAQALFENNQTAQIKFFIHKNKEKNDFYIELDTDFLEGLMQQSVMREVFTKQN